MKKILLSAILLISYIGINAQCTPDPQYAMEDFGFWPQTTAEFNTAVVNIPYEQVINVKAPVNGGEVSPEFSAYSVDSIAISGIVGLPEGYTATCNQPSCIIVGGEQGCLQIAGTTATAGEYPLSINIVIFTNVGGTVLAVPYSYVEYTLTVELTEGIDEITSENVSLGQNSPNPVSYKTVIPFVSKKVEPVTFTVYNMMGERLYERTILSNIGDNTITYTPETLRNGIYLYSLTSNGFTQTRRMIIKR